MVVPLDIAATVGASDRTSGSASKALPAELPVGELRAELVARHLPTHGLRAELVGRLEEDIAAESATPARDIYTTGAAAAAATGYSFS